MEVFNSGMTIVTPIRVSLLEASDTVPLKVNLSCAKVIENEKRLINKASL